MKFKSPSVLLENMDISILSMINIIDDVHREVAGRQAICTSANDGRHMHGSLHYEGKALDLRIRDLGPIKPAQLAKALQTRLGDLYDVVLESDHIHLEYDPDE